MGQATQQPHDQARKVASEVLLLLPQIVLLAAGALNWGTLLLGWGWEAQLRDLGRLLAGDFALLLLLVRHYPQI